MSDISAAEARARLKEMAQNDQTFVDLLAALKRRDAELDAIRKWDGDRGCYIVYAEDYDALRAEVERMNADATQWRIAAKALNR